MQGHTPFQGSPRGRAAQPTNQPTNTHTHTDHDTSAQRNTAQVRAPVLELYDVQWIKGALGVLTVDSYAIVNEYLFGGRSKPAACGAKSISVSRK